MYPVVAVSESAADIENIEQLGSKPKFWYFDDRKGKVECMFKEVTPNTGEDWSEKVACELCQALGVPHAHYDLAMWENRRGVVTPTFVLKQGRLVLGNELLAKAVKEYPAKRSYKVRQHTLSTVLAVLSEVDPPVAFEEFEGVKTAIDVFIGYLMLDAWIANQDRHHENWGLVLLSDQTVCLAPTYDHASSLGRNETDESRRDGLTTNDPGRSMIRFVERARSALFSNQTSAKAMQTLTAFVEAAKKSPTAARSWIARLQAVTAADVRRILDQVPSDRISPIAADFAERILDLNRNRLVTAMGVST